MAVFYHFWANFGCFSDPSHTILMPLRTCRMTVQIFMKIVWTVFEKFETFIERPGEEKNDTIAYIFEKFIRFLKIKARTRLLN